MRHVTFMALSLFVGGCASHSALKVTPASLTEGQWTPFYQRELREGRLVYFYDRAHVQRRGGHVSALWKVVGNPRPTTTLYLVDVSCAGRSFTEKGTLLIDADGLAKKLPASELLLDQTIQPETSADVFWRSFC